MNGLRGGFAGTSSSSRPCVAAQRPSLRPARPTAGRTAVIMAGNSATSGPFAPLVRATRGVVGQKDFNKFRGKAISLHSQVRARLLPFCSSVSRSRVA